MTTFTTFLAPDIEYGGGANAIKKAVGALTGVSGVDVNVDGKQVRVTYDASTASPETLAATLDRAGFPATVTTDTDTDTGISGQTGSLCSCCTSA